MRHAGCMAQGHDGVKGRDIRQAARFAGQRLLAGAIDYLVRQRPGRLPDCMVAHRPSLLYQSLQVRESGHWQYNQARPGCYWLSFDGSPSPLPSDRLSV